MSNPALTKDLLNRIERPASPADVTTLGGTIVKTFILLAILVAAGAVSWSLTFTGSERAEFSGAAIGLMLGGGLGGFVLALVTIFVPRLAPITAPLYAACQGALLGVISAIYEQQFSGLVMQAVALTIGVLMVMLFLYATRIIQPTKYFVLGVVAATMAVALFYLVMTFLWMFGIHTMVDQVFGNGLIGIGFSVLVVGIAALNLIIDFGVIEQNAALGAPKYMEWYGGFALLVTLVWLYLEILRLLAKIRSRD